MPPPLRLEIPLRMLFATTIVVVLTAIAAELGPDWTGVLSPVPVFATVLASFAHARAGPRAPARLLRGIVGGSFGFGAFFVVVARDSPQPRFCWKCNKPLHARTDRCPFCGEAQ